MRPNEGENQLILISLHRGQKCPTPPPIPTLGNLEYFLLKPFEGGPQPSNTQLSANSFPITSSLNPTKRDRLLSYACSSHDTFVTGESPPGPDGPITAHVPMLLPLLELLHGLDSGHLQTALSLGCVHHCHGLHQRPLDANCNLLERYPNNVRRQSPIFGMNTDASNWADQDLETEAHWERTPVPSIQG
jgi:hypothetical protein